MSEHIESNAGQAEAEGTDEVVQQGTLHLLHAVREDDFAADGVRALHQEHGPGAVLWCLASMAHEAEVMLGREVLQRILNAPPTGYASPSWLPGLDELLEAGDGSLSPMIVAASYHQMLDEISKDTSLWEDEGSRDTAFAIATGVTILNEWREMGDDGRDLQELLAEIPFSTSVTALLAVTFSALRSTADETGRGREAAAQELVAWIEARGLLSDDVA